MLLDDFIVDVCFAVDADSDAEMRSIVYFQIVFVMAERCLCLLNNRLEINACTSKFVIRSSMLHHAVIKHNDAMNVFLCAELNLVRDENSNFRCKQAFVAEIVAPNLLKGSF